MYVQVSRLYVSGQLLREPQQAGGHGARRVSSARPELVVVYYVPGNHIHTSRYYYIYNNNNVLKI